MRGRVRMRHTLVHGSVTVAALPARAIAALGFWLRVGSVRATSSQRSQHSLGHYSNKY